MKRTAAALLVVATALPACASNPSTTLTVFAASSLTAAFQTIARDYEALHPSIRIRLSFGGSTSLARQIRDGAPADVFAAADAESLTPIKQFLSGPAVTFARNTLTIAVRAGNPKRITEPADLARAGVIVVVCASEVPCGRRTDQMLRRAGVTITPASRENSVRSALTKLISGEADAAVVYATDIRAGGAAIAGVTIPASVNVTTTYPITAVRSSPAPDEAGTFISYVTSPPGQRTLAEFGFPAP